MTANAAEQPFSAANRRTVPDPFQSFNLFEADIAQDCRFTYGNVGHLHKLRLGIQRACAGDGVA